MSTSLLDATTFPVGLCTLAPSEVLISCAHQAREHAGAWGWFARLPH